MSNLIQIKRGSGKPEQHVLKPHELGFDTLNKKLYIGDINENPINVGRPIETVPAESFDVANADKNTIYILESDDAVVTTSVLESASAEFRVGLEDVSQRVSDIEEAIESGIGGGGSGGGAIPDWNQNNPAAADYIKNRPFYTGSVEKEIYDVNAELTAASGALASMQVSATEYLHQVNTSNSDVEITPINLVEGKQYVIIADGNRYEYTAQSVTLGADYNYAHCVYIGELDALLTQDIANFTIGIATNTFPNGYVMTGAACKSTSATPPTSFKVYGFEEEVVQLDPKYYERLAWVEEGLSDKWEFSGNIEDYETYLMPSDLGAPEGSCLIRVSPNYIEPEKLVGAYGAVYSSGNIFENTFSEDMIEDISSEVGFQAYSINGMMTSFSQDFPVIGFPAGTFFMYIPNYMWVVSVTTLEPIFDTEVVHTIDPKFFEKGTVGWTEPGETSAVWTFDGNLDNVEYYDVGSGTYYVRVLDRYIEPELLIGGSCTGTLEGMEDTVTITSSMIDDISGQTGFPAYQVNGQFGLVVSESFNGLPAGVYIMYIPDYVIVNRLVFTEDVFVLKEETVHKIDPKFLPDNIGGGGGNGIYVQPEAPENPSEGALWVDTDEGSSGGTGGSTGGSTGNCSIELDNTLTQSGKAADAKAVGDALAELEAKIPEGDNSNNTEIPFFDLAAMGLPAISADGTIVSIATDTSEIIAALERGLVNFGVQFIYAGMPVNAEIVGAPMYMEVTDTYQVTRILTMGVLPMFGSITISGMGISAVANVLQVALPNAEGASF